MVCLGELFMPNQMVDITAITAKAFLTVQIQKLRIQ
jgi:hypothetical protein